MVSYSQTSLYPLGICNLTCIWGRDTWSVALLHFFLRMRSRHTVLIRDAKQLFVGERGGVLDPSLVVHELLYADDTLLMDASGGSVEQYMRCVEEVGAEFGLTFNFSKLESMPVRCADVVHSPGGGEIPTKSSMVYLGGLISNDGKIDSELARRIGMEMSDFRSLQKVWGHSGLTLQTQT